MVHGKSLWQDTKDAALAVFALCLVVSVSFTGGLLDKLNEQRALLAQSCYVPDDGVLIGSRERDTTLWPGKVHCTTYGGRHENGARPLNRKPRVQG